MQLVNFYRICCTLLATIVLLSGCSISSSYESPLNEIKLTDTENGSFSSVIYTLTKPPKALIGTDSTQLIAVDFSGQQQQFIAQLEFSDNQIALVGISTTGIPLFDVVWRSDESIVLNQYIPIPELNVEFVIADIQWTHWPINQLKSAVVGDNIRVEEAPFASNSKTPPQGLWQRRLLQNNVVILEVNNYGNYYILENKLRNYTIKITNLNKEPK